MLYRHKIRMVILVIVLLGALNSSLLFFNINGINYISDLCYDLVRIRVNKIIYVILALALVLFASHKSTWFPYLNETVIPTGLLKNSTPPNANQVVQLLEKPNTKIVYWSVYPNSTNKNRVEAYDDFANAGVTTTDKDGNAELNIMRGTDYFSMGGEKINRHIVYRLVDYDGMLGPIKIREY